MNQTEYEKRKAERKEKYKGIERINNALLPAGSPMTYYCEECGAPIVLPECHRCPAPKYCNDCLEGASG